MRRASPTSHRVVDEQFRVILPPVVREALRLKPGDTVLFETEGNSAIVRRARVVPD